MSKVTFRAKALEHNRKMAIYVGDEIPELTDFAIVNRTVPEMPSGMEKEEETQHHLQKALSAQQACGSITNLIIPIPELGGAGHYERIYSTKAGFTLPKKFIHVQPSTTDQELPDYDMDTEDESWLGGHKSIYDDLDSDPIRFENMVDKLEKGSGHLVVKLNEAKALIKEKDDVVIAVYDYWLNKRIRQEKRIKEALASKAENVSAQPTPTQSSTVNPYLAFRKRAEKMQTRKNRKNDEQSYLGILQLRKSFEKTKALLELLKLRESSKRDLMETKRNIFEKRHELRDWSGEVVMEMEKTIGPVHLPDMSYLFAQSTLDDDHHAQVTHPSLISTPISSLNKYNNNRFVLTTSSERSRKRKKKYRRQHDQQLHGWGDGSDVASDDVCDDLDDEDCKIKNSRNVPDHDDKEELEKISRLLSFFKPVEPSVVPSCGWEEDSGDSVLDNSEDEVSPDGPYTFRRREGCYYQAPISFENSTDASDVPTNQILTQDVLRTGQCFSLATLSNPPTTAYMRQRIGRGGRVIIDRMSSIHRIRTTQNEFSLHSMSHNPTTTTSQDGAPHKWHANCTNQFSKREEKGLDASAGLLASRSDPSTSTKEMNNPQCNCIDDPQMNPQHHDVKGFQVTHRQDQIFPETFCPSLSFNSTSSSTTSSTISSTMMATTSSTSSQETTVRASRALFLFGSSCPSSASGYKRKYSNRTDSEDSGVCSPSPTPSTGSFPGTNPPSDIRLLELKNGNSFVSKAQEIRGLNSKNTKSVSSMEVDDDGISDDHSTNGDSCSSFSDHKVRGNSSHFSQSAVFSHKRSDKMNHRNSFSGDHKISKMETISDRKESIQQVKKHLTSFDDGKFSLLANKMIIKEVTLSQVEDDARNNKGLRYQQCQLKLTDVNNLISRSGEVITALEVS